MPKKETTDAPFVRQTEQGLKTLTAEGHVALAKMVTNTNERVYAFKPGVDPMIGAAAFARLSRSENGSRVVIADEFIGFGQDEKSEQLLRRVVTMFGDDSVMQLYPMMMGIDAVSNLAIKRLENGRLAAYLEQSSRYLRFDKKDESGNYQYVVPSELPEKVRQHYVEKLDTVFDIYSELYQKVLAHLLGTQTKPEDMSDRAWHTTCHAQACDTVRGLLPAATKASLGIVASSQAFYNLILSLQAEQLPELNRVGDEILTAARAIAPVLFERADNPTRGGIISANRRDTRAETRALAAKLAKSHGLSDMPETGRFVKLHAVDGLEDQLIAKILFDDSSFGYTTWLEAVKKMSKKEKEDVLSTYVGKRDNRRVKPWRAFETLQYSFEIQCDFGAFRDIHRHRMVDGFEWQKLTPKLGYETPELITKIGAKDRYQEAFAVSEALYDYLVDNNFEEQAQYATLFGHNMRFSFTINARSLFHSAELRTAVQGHWSYRTVYMDMVKEVEKKHPFITRYMKFLNTDDSAELARLDAEFAQQKKLDALDSEI